MAIKKRKLRGAPRKQTHPISVSSMTSLDDLTKLARQCEIVEASSSGLLLHVERKSLVPSVLRQNLNIDALVGSRVFLKLDDMNLEVSGVVSRTRFIGKGTFVVAVDYSEDAPEYWRECLMDLLPRPGELD